MLFHREGIRGKDYSVQHRLQDHDVSIHSMLAFSCLMAICIAIGCEEPGATEPDSGPDAGMLDARVQDSGSFDAAAVLDSANGADGGAVVEDAGPADAGGRTVPVVTVGLGHTCVLRVDGTVACFGANLASQAGEPGDVPRVFLPNTIVGFNVDSVAAGAVFNCGIAGGRVACFGHNGGLGLLGNDAVEDSAAPVDVAADDAVQIACGDAQACVVHVDGGVSCWGSNEDGQMGVSRDDAALCDHFSSYQVCREPVRVVGLTDVKSVTTGLSHVCAHITDGTVRCWGDGEAGQLGDGEMGCASPPPFPECHYNHVATEVAGLGRVLQVSAGGATVCAVVPDHTVRCWGANSHGQLGNGRIGADALESTPVAVTGLTDIVQVAVGKQHACALDSSGAVWCWGAGADGAIGQLDDSPIPLRIAGITDVVQIAVHGHSCAVTTLGKVMCWGANNMGQLGLGSTDPSSSSTPVEVIGL